jgi:hypothetical protein
MTKLFAVIMCLVFTLGIIVASMGRVNQAIVKPDGLRDRAVSWIERSIPEPANQSEQE